MPVWYSRCFVLFFPFHKSPACHSHSPLPFTSTSLVISASCRLRVDPFRRRSLFRVWFECKRALLLPLCSRCSSGYVCPTGMRVSPLGSSCDGGERSVRGGVTGSTVHLSPHPCPPHCSGPTGRPLRDGGCVMQSHVSAISFSPSTLTHAFFFHVNQVSSVPRG